MNEVDSRNTATPVEGKDAPPRYRRWIALVLIGALLAGGVAWLITRVTSGWLAQQDAAQKLVRDLNAVEAQADRLEARQADLSASAQRSASQVSEFADRIAQHDEIVGQLKDQISGGHGRFQLASVEQLLLLANDRLLLARDVGSAVMAIEEADARLVALREPRLFAVRQALAQEKAALLAVPVPDYAGAALSLSSLIARVPRLPLAARIPAHFEATPEHLQLADDARWYQRLWASVRIALSNLFTIRRDTGPSPRLLSAEQEALVVQVLALKLEGARIALLRDDTASFRDLIESSSDWLDAYFRDDDSGVIATRAELQRLRPLDLNPPLPDISRSLVLLRAFLTPAAAP